MKRFVMPSLGNNGNNNTRISHQFKTNFTFPSIDERLEYYMGDWYNRTLNPKNISCREIKAKNKIVSDKPVLWGLQQMEQTILKDRKKNWLVGSYLVNCFDVMNNTEEVDNIASDNNRRAVVLNIGDSHSRSAILPVVAKTRFSRFATKKGKGEHFFKSIIFPLSMSRHYNYINEYIQLYKEGNVSEWKHKKPTVIWRGSLTGVKNGLDRQQTATHLAGGPRIQVVRQYYNGNVSQVDVAFQKGPSTTQWAPHAYKQDARLIRETHTSMFDQLKFKYILMLEGNDVATGLKWQLASNSVVFMAKPTTVSFLMEDLLVPFVHYVPLKDDYSDIVEMVEWARKNDKMCKWISEQATLYMERLWISKQAKTEYTIIKKKLGDSYHEKFGEALKSCA